MESLQPATTSTPNLTVPSLPDSDAMTLYLTLKSAPEKNQLQIIPELAAAGEVGLSALMKFLLDRQSSLPNNPAKPAQPSTSTIVADLAAGKSYSALLSAQSAAAAKFLDAHFPQGVVPLRSEAGLDYTALQTLLAQQNFQAADQMTIQKLCELAGPAASQRKWIYFTEVEAIPIADLHTINTLWLVYSEGKFGFSVQREIWLSVNQNWEKVWSKIGWKMGNNWTRYPQEFTWNLTAPRGHLPLSNQLRGVRVISALLSHPAWSKQ